MHDVATTRKTIASARRPDIFIASPGREVMDKHRLFSGHIGPQRAMRQRRPVAYPTSGLRSHTFRPVEVRRIFGTGRRDDSSSASQVAQLPHNSLQLQSLPAYFLPWRMAASHAEDLGVARLDLLALRLPLGGIGLEQFQGGKRDVLALLLDLSVKGAVRKDVEQHLLGFRAEEEALEQPCR